MSYLLGKMMGKRWENDDHWNWGIGGSLWSVPVDVLFDLVISVLAPCGRMGLVFSEIWAYSVVLCFPRQKTFNTIVIITIVIF